MDDRQQKPVPGRIGVGLSLALFGVPALLLWLATTQLLPLLVARGWEPLSAWFAELWWRGFIQPRQEPVFGRSTWLVQGLLHGLFHFSFGFGVVFLLMPVVLAIPWAVQRTRNTSVGIVIHAGVNGPGFLVVTLGLIRT